MHPLASSSPKQPAATELVIGLLVLAIAAAILVYFHNRFWWPPDDGAYGYVAQRLLRGAVLNIDIRDVHAGYVHFTHMLAMKWFGEDLLSMRYPLAALTLLQSITVFYLMRPSGTFVQFAAAICAASLSFVMFLNPTANWYALALAFFLWAVFAWTPPGSARRYILAGFLVGLCILFRQLSGAFLAMAAVLIVFDEVRDQQAGSSWAGRSVLALIAIVLIFYYVSKESWTAFFMFGIWPLLLTLFVARRMHIGSAMFVRIAALMSAGFAIAALPLVIYIISHGTGIAWFHDAVGAAFGLHGMDFIKLQNFSVFAIHTIAGLLQGANLASFLNTLFWLALLAAPPVLGLIICLRSRAGEQSLMPGPVIAIFFGQGAAHYQIPVYLLIPTSLTIVALLTLPASLRARRVASGCAIGLCAIALVYQAAQPLTRGVRGIVQGQIIPLDNAEPVARASLKMEAADGDIYRRIIAIIEAHSAANDPILAVPFIPEFYFLTARRSIYRSVGIPFEFATAADITAAIATLDKDPPRVVVHRREDKYNTAAALAIMAAVRERYRLPQTAGDFDVYLPR